MWKTKAMTGLKSKEGDREMAGRDGIGVLTENVRDLVGAIVDGKLEARADVEGVDEAYRPVLEGINELIEVFVRPINVTAEYVDRISKGDIPDKIADEYRGDFNEIKNNLNGLIDALNGLVGEAERMKEAAAAGELDTRADVSRYHGAWAAIVQGLNETAEGMVVPMRDIGGVLDRMAAGDLKARVTNDYKGDYNVLKVACNEL
ncbi:MAG: methyl-accepting chemotaxis protein, partial [Deltaproteobacteria bacterium]|nr:methyl-accepting chemotaxis protein [Deltaproteobacteria bacterium]